MQVKLMKVMMILLMTTLFNKAFTQAPRPFYAHEVIDVGGGMKVEILSCRNEGPLEECDCIYYTDRRQNGKRQWQNANRIREDQKAAKIEHDAAMKLRQQQMADSIAKAKASGIQPVKKEKPVDENNPALVEKRIKERIDNLTTKPQTTQSLADIARRSDSLARRREQGTASTNAGTTGTEQDEVVIPTKPVAKAEVKGTSAPPAKEQPVAKADVPPAVTSTPQTSSNADAEKEATIDSAVEQTSYVKQYTQTSAQPVVDKPAAKPVEEKQPQQASTNAATGTVGVVSAPATISEQKKTAASADTTATVSTAKPVESKPVETKTTEAKPAATADVPKEKTPEPVAPPAKLDKQDAAATNTTDTIDLEIEAKKFTYVTTNPKTSAAAEKKPEPASQTAPAIAADTMHEAETTTPKETAAPAKAEEVKAASTDNKTKGTSSSSNFLKTAEVNVNGAWQEAVIMEQEGESLFKVHYADKGAEADEWVTSAQLRNLDSVRQAPAIANNKAEPTKPEQKQGNSVKCNFNAPVPAVSNAAQFSDKIAKRRIYENFLYAKKKSGQGKVGVVFLYFQTEEPYTNSIIETQSLTTRNATAPTGAMIYPIKAKIQVCDQTGSTVTTNVVDRKYACYRNQEGVWTCMPEKQ